MFVCVVWSRPFSSRNFLNNFFPPHNVCTVYQKKGPLLVKQAWNLIKMEAPLSGWDCCKERVNYMRQFLWLWNRFTGLIHRFNFMLRTNELASFVVVVVVAFGKFVSWTLNLILEDGLFDRTGLKMGLQNYTSFNFSRTISRFFPLNLNDDLIV